MQKRALSSDDLSKLILLAAILFGGLFRLMPAFLAGFPVNDGGMFYAMILDLKAKHYMLPEFTSYNNISIPYAYPPLGFYLGAALSDLLNVSPIIILQWLPGILNTFCIPALYLFAKEIFQDKLQASIAGLVFAFIPHMSTWLSMGGGLTRSLGTLFLTLAMVFNYRLFSADTFSRRDVFLTILFACLTILSHTESSVFLFTTCIYIWALKSHSWRGIKIGVIISLCVLVVISAVWLGLVVSRHGFEPYISALQTGGHSFASAIKIINVDAITQENYIDILGTIGILGCIILLSKRQYFIPGLLLLVFIAEPRSAHTVANIPLSLAGSYFLIKFLTTDHLLLRLSLALISPFIFANSIYTGYALSRSHITSNELTAMEWINRNLPKESKFLVLNGETEAQCDALTEWFPAMTKRTSVSTMQGREWLLGKRFTEFIGKRDALQSCMYTGIDCLNKEIKYFDEADYIYVSLYGNCSSGGSSPIFPVLISELKKSLDHKLIFESKETIIFSLEKQ